MSAKNQWTAMENAAPEWPHDYPLWVASDSTAQVVPCRTERDYKQDAWAASHWMKMADLPPPPSPVAPGLNHQKLTCAQVETENGWRLLTPDEHFPSRKIPDCEYWSCGEWNRATVDGTVWTDSEPLRTRKPANHFLSKPSAITVAQVMDAALDAPATKRDVVRALQAFKERIDFGAGELEAADAAINSLKESGGVAK